MNRLPQKSGRFTHKSWFALANVGADFVGDAFIA